MTAWNVPEPPSAGLVSNFVVGHEGLIQQKLHHDDRQLSMLNFALSED
jgi:hypothetical protein